MLWSHLAYPDRWRHKSDRPWHRGLNPLLFSNNVTGSFTPPPPPFQLKYKDEGDKANGVTSTPDDAIIWTEKRDSQLAWCHQFFKDLGWWSVRGLNSRPADRAAAVKWPLYYVGKMKETIFPKLRVHIKENNNLPHGKFHQFLFPFSSKFPDLNQFRPICSLYLLMLYEKIVSVGYLCWDKFPWFLCCPIVPPLNVNNNNNLYFLR